MQDLKKIREQRAPTIIGAKDLEYDLLVREARRRHAIEDKEARDIFNQGEIALDNAADNGDEHETLHTHGRIVTSNRARHNKYLTTHVEKDEHGLKALMRTLAAVGVSAAVIETWMKGVGATISQAGTNMASTFAAKSKDIMADVVYDEHFVYGGEEVSVRTADLFQKRMNRILEARKAMLDTTTLEEYLEKREAYIRLVERSDVIFHPEIGPTFKSEKVYIVDKAVDSTDGPACGIVPTFRPHSACGIDGRKRKIDVADQYDQDPNETVGEVKAEPPARPIPPAQFNMVG